VPKNYKTASTFVKVMQTKTSRFFFSGHGVVTNECKYYMCTQRRQISGQE